jgi:glycosyltransferase involved in cell wall biosynthesis
MKSGRLQIWVPELIAREGGIQSYSIEMVEAAAEILGPGRVTVLSKSDDPAALELWAGGRVATRATGHIPLPARTVAFAGLLLREGLAEDPDLVITTHANFSPVARTLFRTRRIPAAVAAHGIEVWDLEHGRTRNSLMAADTILPVSDYTKTRLMLELGLPDDRFQVIPDTFDPVRFSPGPAPAGLRERYGLRASDQVLLCVSRLEASEQYKGYRQILEVLPSLTQKIPNLKFVIVGRGSDRPNIERQIERLNLRDYVVLAGFVPSQELADHYRMADAFAMPSKREGFGIVYLEAMGCGKKCLGGDKDAAVDALRHGELGILVDPDNLHELEEGLFRLMTEPPPDPKALHDAVNRYFGREVFRQKVKALLESFGIRR